MSIIKLTKEQKENLWAQEFTRLDTRSLVRIRANQILHVCFPEGVDELTDLAKSLFDIIPPSAPLLRPGTSKRDLFQGAVELLLVLVQLAMVNGRSDLEHIGIALHAGLVALKERKKGFEEPLFRARRRSRRQPRDTFYVRQLKALATEACSRLKQYGMKDAASQVAMLINRGSFLPSKRNGQAIVVKSVSNWCKQTPRQFVWLFRPEMNRLAKGSELWRAGHHSAARQAVLRELSARLKEMKCIWMET